MTEPNTERPRRRWAALGIALLLALAAGVGALGFAGAVPLPPATSYVPVAPSRILDTRYGTGAPVGKIATDMNLMVRGIGGIPMDAVSVVLNVTVTDATDASFLAVRPALDPANVVSNLNFGPGDTVANQVTVKIGSNGEIWFHNQTGQVHVVADLAGYYVPGATAADHTAYGFMYQLSAGAVVPPGGAIPFSNNGPGLHTSHAPGATTMTVDQPGVYRVTYDANLYAPPPPPPMWGWPTPPIIGVAVNGTMDPSSADSNYGQMRGTVLLTLVAGDVLTLQNGSLFDLIVSASNGIPGARFTVEQIAGP